MQKEFLNKITEIILEHLSNERFGVSELAHELGMSRSNLLRKIQQHTKLSASQFIRQVRLKEAEDLLKTNSFTVSEIAYKVGFSSPSYFIKCFHEDYGYPPGEVAKRMEAGADSSVEIKSSKKKLIIVFSAAIALVFLGIAFYYLFIPDRNSGSNKEKSIAVLPFKNDSDDSSNVYIVNGIMESILTNLQTIKSLRVISRTSVEKFRNVSKSIPEISEELDVNYFVEGSGQKIGDTIFLNIQLIEATSDKHIWATQFKREAKDIFDLQIEVAKYISDNIEAIITPEEEVLIQQLPTEDHVAYDYFLQGLDLMRQGTFEGLEASIPLFQRSIDQDNTFGRAYADIALAYYFLDVLQTNKIYNDSINRYADKALLYAPKSSQSLVAKAMFYQINKEYELATTYLEKALEYSPNSAFVLGYLSEMYNNYIPNTEKYLEYALKGISLDIVSLDSVASSYTYLHISNAFVQSGFVEESEFYIKKSLDFASDNLFSERVKAFIGFAKNRDLKKLKDELLLTYNQDTTRLDVLQEVGKAYYYLRDYEQSYVYYKKFIDLKSEYGMNIFPGENIKIALVYAKTGHKPESDYLLEEYKRYADQDNSIYRHLSLSVYHAYKGNVPESIAYLKLFAEEENYHLWTLLFLGIDPLVDSLKKQPEFERLMSVIEDKFWDKHNQIKKRLSDKKLIH